MSFSKPLFLANKGQTEPTGIVDYSSIFAFQHRQTMAYIV